MNISLREKFANIHIDPRAVTGLQQRHIEEGCGRVTNIHLAGGTTLSTDLPADEVVIWLADVRGASAIADMPVTFDSGRGMVERYLGGELYHGYAYAG